MEVTLKFIKNDPWSGVMKYPGCYTGLASVWTRSGRRYTGLTVEDATRLEKAMGYVEGTLAPASSFWDTYCVRITDKPMYLNLENPEDELKYLFAKGHKRVAFGTANIRPSHDFVLINTEVEAEQANVASKAKREAFKAYDKMSIEDMRKCLRLYGHKTENLSNELIESKVFELLEKDPGKFMSLWVNNKHKETQFIIESAIAKNIIRKQKNIYYYGTEVIGHSLQDTIATMDSKENQDIRIAIMAEIESK